MRAESVVDANRVFAENAMAMLEVTVGTLMSEPAAAEWRRCVRRLRDEGRSDAEILLRLATAFSDVPLPSATT